MFNGIYLFITDTFNSAPLLFTTKLLATAYQAFAIFKIATYVNYNSSNRKYSLLAIAFVATTMVINLHWIIQSGDKLDLFSVDKIFRVAFNRICWSLLVLNKLVLSYTTNSLINKKHRILNTLEFLIGSLLCGFFIFISIYYFYCIETANRPSIEFASKTWVYFYACYIYLKVSILTANAIYNNNVIPKIKKQQLQFLLFYIFIPQFLSDLLTANPFAFSSTYKIQNYGFKSVTTALLTYAMHYCARNLFNLRFLNTSSQVGASQNHQFTTDFKPILERVSSVSTADELKRIVKQFIANNYNLPEHAISLYIRESNHSETPAHGQSDKVYKHIEQVLQEYVFHDQSVMNMLYDYKVIIHDEIAFSQEYNPTHAQAVLLHICQQLRASAFIPIFQYDRLVGYMLIEEHAREELFTQREQDELLMLSHYLSNVIHLLSHRNIGNVIAREKTLQAQLYHREREIEQYKESMRSCFHASEKKSIGVMVYKSRRFNFRNKAAQDISGIDPNKDKGHPLAKKLKEIVNKVETQQQLKTVSAYNGYNRKVIISAVPELDANGIIITLHYPEVTEAVHEHMHTLENPHHWNYLLYLETTDIGRHLEQLIPGKSEHILNIKLSLLQAALSKYPVIISGQQEDTLEIVSFLHKVSDRDVFQTMPLNAPERNGHVTRALLGSSTDTAFSDPSMLEQLHEQGTLFIDNIHFLSFQTQKQLGHYLQYGYFQRDNSEYKLISDVRLIGTTTYPVSTLLEQGMMLPSFYNLFPYIISLPQLETLTGSEFQTLVDAMADHIISDQTVSRLLSFTPYEYAQLQRTASGSLHELRQEIARLIRKKSHDSHLDTEQETVHVPQEPTLFRAAQLGKEALKDRELMIFLWNTFKSQSKIATLLNVNRSSVNRRIKQYNLDHESYDVQTDKTAISQSSQRDR